MKPLPSSSTSSSPSMTTKMKTPLSSPSKADLAPLVAAALHDSVVADMYNELQALRLEVEQYRTIELTGPAGSPVFGSWNFVQDGHYSSSDSSTNTWVLENVSNHRHNQTENESSRCDQDPLLTLPFGRCLQLEIRVGGMVKAVWFNSIREGFVTSCQYDAKRGMATNISLCFGYSAGLWMRINMEMSYVSFLELTAGQAVTTPNHDVQNNQNADQNDDPIVGAAAGNPNAHHNYVAHDDNDDDDDSVMMMDGGGMLETEQIPVWMLEHIPRHAVVEIHQLAFLVDKMSGAMQTWKIAPLQHDGNNHEHRQSNCT